MQKRFRPTPPQEPVNSLDIDPADRLLSSPCTCRYSRPPCSCEESQQWHACFGLFHVPVAQQRHFLYLPFCACGFSLRIPGRSVNVRFWALLVYHQIAPVVYTMRHEHYWHSANAPMYKGNGKQFIPCPPGQM